jgi:hypothetical protein
MARLRPAMIIGLMAVLGIAAPAAESPDGHRILDAKSQVAVRDTIGRLVEIVDELQEAIVQDLQGEKKKMLYRQAEEILGELEEFQSSLKVDVAREDAYKRFEMIDANVQRLLTHFQSFGPSEHSLVRPATRMQYVTDELHYTLSLADPAPNRIRQALERQARDLVVAAKNLQRTAEFAIGDTRARGAILGDLAILTQDAQAVSDSLVKKAASDVITKACQSVTATWTRVIEGIRLLSHKENIYLMRTAFRVDLLQERVFRLSGMKGQCPRLDMQG